jgi:hypothetical protein
MVDWKKVKDGCITIIFLVFGLPLVIAFLVWVGSMVINSGNPDKLANITQEGANLIVEAVTPWWTGLIVWLCELGFLGAILIIVLVKFLEWIGEIPRK